MRGWRWDLKMVPPRAFSGCAHASRVAADRSLMRIGRPSARGPPATEASNGRAPSMIASYRALPAPNTPMGQRGAPLARGEPSSEMTTTDRSRGMTTKTTPVRVQCKGSFGRASWDVVPAGGLNAALRDSEAEADRWTHSP